MLDIRVGGGKCGSQCCGSHDVRTLLRANPVGRLAVLECCGVTAYPQVR